MKIKPVLTEKTMKDAAIGKYTFIVPVKLSKFQIKELIGKAFAVDVKSVRTQVKTGRTKTTLTRSKINVKPQKRAIVTLKGKGTIDIFDTETKKGGKKK